MNSYLLSEKSCVLQDSNVAVNIHFLFFSLQHHLAVDAPIVHHSPPILLEADTNRYLNVVVPRKFVVIHVLPRKVPVLRDEGPLIRK
jgi:hypothetical protein